MKYFPDKENNAWNNTCEYVRLQGKIGIKVARGIMTANQLTLK